MSKASEQNRCFICKKELNEPGMEESSMCRECEDISEQLFDNEMRLVELLRLIRGQDVELYDIIHPASSTDDHHCGQVVLIKAGQGFEVKICLKSGALDWAAPISDGAGFTSPDTRLDALIGNLTLLIESWGGGPHYMDIFYIDKVLSIEGEL